MKKEVEYKGLKFEPYITQEQINARVQELAAQISKDCDGKEPLFLCVLTGAFPFASDLFRAVDIDAEISFIRLQSYQGMSTTGVVKQVMGLGEEIKGRNVVIVEDIIDTGHTMHNLIATVKEKGAADIKIATLLFKPSALCRPVKPDYVGFEIPTKFIIGYGLDICHIMAYLKDVSVIQC